jgi:hypothetical protein
MVRTEQLAEAALAGDALLLRSLTLDWLRENPSLAKLSPPQSQDETVNVVAAGLVDLLASRCGQSPPPWTANIGSLPQPFYLVKSAKTMRRLRELCDAQSPPSLRKRNLLAPPTFLTFA